MRQGFGDAGTLRFRYSPRRGTMALAGLFFVGCGVMLSHVARTNTSGLVIDRLIRLDPATATGFYWLLTACCAGFVIVALWSIASSFGAERWVELDGQAITAPRFGYSRAPTRIALADVADVRLRQLHRQRFVELIAKDGRRLSIPASMLTSDGAFDELVAALERAWHQA